MKMAARIEKMQPDSHYSGTTKPSKAGPVWTGKLALAPDHVITAPLHWRKPRLIFVNSMGDLFHEDVPDAWIDRVFAVMALCPQHIFQVLTKRSKRMRDYLNGPAEAILLRLATSFEPGTAPRTQHEIEAHLHPNVSASHRGVYRASLVSWPLPNVWLGVSCEDQTRADERIPDLLDTPAAVRWVSAEPLLGPIDFTRIAHENDQTDHYYHALDGYVIDGSQSQTAQIDWIVVGGESGPGARPMHPEWARSIRDQCAASYVPFYMKQMGGVAKSQMPTIPDDLMVRDFPKG
jgi:protein gp37